MVSKTSQTSLQILYALSFSHLLNDTIQSVLPAIFPVLQESFQLSFTQIGLISFTLQMTASVLQPMIGFYADRRPQPYSLAVGMGFTLVGLLILSQAVRLEAMLLSAALVGIGSSVFHPEASRVAHLASGGRYGLAQSLFQVGGNLGTSLGPLLAAGIIVPHGQSSIAWFSLLAILGMVVLIRVGSWSQTHVRQAKQNPQILQRLHKSFLPASQIVPALLILLVLIISKYFYLANFTNFYTFYLMSKFRLSVQASQVCLFVFLFSVAVGTIFGGPLGDRFGRKVVIWFSILGAAPFSMALPHVGLVGTVILSACAGAILASAFSTILVFAQELLPGNIGTVAGLFFGLAFSISGVASAALGRLADQTSIEYLFQVCAYLPLFGILAVGLPKLPSVPPAVIDPTSTR